MRDYGTVSPKFWVGSLGRQLRGNPATQIVALYLMTSPHANLMGLYYCPIEYIIKETGLSLDAVTKALQILNAADFCTYDQDAEMLFVHKFAQHQIGTSLTVGDKRIRGIENELKRIPRCSLVNQFLERYAHCFKLSTSPFGAPSKPHPSDEDVPPKPGKETKTTPSPTHDIDIQPGLNMKNSVCDLPTHTLPDSFKAEIQVSRPDLDPDIVWGVFAQKTNPKDRTIAVWRSWIARERSPVKVAVNPRSDPDTRSSIEAEGVARGLGAWQEGKEQWASYKAKVRGDKLPGLTVAQLAQVAQRRTA